MVKAKQVILMPYAEASSDDSIDLAPRIDSLNGKVIGLLANGWRSLDYSYEEFKKLLEEKYEVAEVIIKRKPGSSPLPIEELEDVAARADAVISALGN